MGRRGSKPRRSILTIKRKIDRERAAKTPFEYKRSSVTRAVRDAAAVEQNIFRTK